jgi:hypothetical protein
LAALVFTFFQKHSSQSHVRPFVSPSTSSFLDTLTANLLTQIPPSGSDTIGTEQLRKNTKEFCRINPQHKVEEVLLHWLNDIKKKRGR